MQIVDRDVPTRRHPRVGEPGRLQPTGRDEPVHELTQPPLLQLTAPLGRDPLRVGLDKRYHGGSNIIGDHGIGCSTANPTGESTLRPRYLPPRGVG